MNPSFTPCRYLLVWTSPEDPKHPAVVVIPTVGSIQAEQAPATVVRFPADPFAAAYVEDGPVRHEPITLSGTSGLEARQGSALDGSLAILSGPELFEAMRDFLANYATEAARKRNATTRGLAPTLKLYATWEGLAWVIGKHKLTWRHTTRDGTLTYQWSLQLEAIGRDDGTLENIHDPLAGEDLSPIENAELAGLGRDGYGTVLRRDATGATQWHIIETNAQKVRSGGSLVVSDGLWPEGMPGPLSEDAVVYPDLASDTFAVELAAIASGIGATGGRIKNSIEDAQRVVNRVANLRRVAENVFDFPATVYSDALSVVERGLIEIDRALDDVALEPTSAFARSLRRYDAASNRFKRSLERAFANSGQTRVPSTEAPGGFAAADRVTVRGGETCIVRVTNGGETLPQFALRVLGSRDLWRTIQRLNRITDPWRTNLGVPIGTGGFGLLVPDDGGPKVPRDGTSNVFGQTWRVDDDGQLIWYSGAGLDVAIGLSCYIQAMTMVFRHKLGTLAADPLCGMLDIVGEVLVPTDLARVLANMRAQALRDSRTLAVERLRIVQENDTVLLAADIRPAAGETQVVSVPVTFGGA